MSYIAFHRLIEMSVFKQIRECHTYDRLLSKKKHENNGRNSTKSLSSLNTIYRSHMIYDRIYGYRVRILVLDSLRKINIESRRKYEKQTKQLQLTDHRVNKWKMISQKIAIILIHLCKYTSNELSVVTIFSIHSEKKRRNRNFPLILIVTQLEHIASSNSSEFLMRQNPIVFQRNRKTKKII